jgi:hypothetical protein
MKISVSLFTCLIFGILLSAYPVSSTVANADNQSVASRQDRLASFAKCLSEKGYFMYGSFTCASCRAQRNNFGKAFEYIKEIECNPAAPGNQVELCLEKKIRKLPTWIQETDGQELKRLEGYQLLEFLASSSGCAY